MLCYRCGRPISRPVKPAIPEELKSELSVKAHELVDLVLKPKTIEPARENSQFNCLIDIYQIQRRALLR
jgi:hypothetical protein